MNLFNHALSVWAQHREFRAVFAELARHTDRELRDMGIDRERHRPDRLPGGGAAHRDARHEQHACHGWLQPLPGGRRVSDRFPTELQPGRRAPLAPSCRELPERNLPC